MISKELLVSVLPYPQNQFVEFVKTDDIYIKYGARTQDNINIYELAHKCKEFLIEQTDNDIELRSNKDVSIVSIYIKEEADFHYEYADTENEAIFKSCQYILENKNDR